MTLRIYGAPRSRTFRVMWAAEELGLPYENIPVDFAEGSKQPAFLAINPNGRIPAIDDEGFVLFESLAINMYLAKKHGGASSTPPRRRTRPACGNGACGAPTRSRCR